MSRLFNGNTDSIEVIIRDGTGSKIETRAARLNDSKSMKNILGWLKAKYDFEDKDSDTDWLSLENDFFKF